MAVSNRVASEAKFIHAGKSRPPVLSSVNKNGEICLEMTPGVFVQGTRAEIQDWFGHACITVADTFFDDLQAAADREIRKNVAREYGVTQSDFELGA